MKAKLKARVLEVIKRSVFQNGSESIDNMVKLKILTSKGKVDTTLNTNAQFIALDGNLYVREVVADQMKIGAILTITVSDEETGE
jgi:hypothetical protein